MLKDLLDQIKGFKYQITLKVLLSKYKKDRDIKFAPVYFNCPTKTVIVPEDSLEKSFQEGFNRIDNWISERSDWITESIDAEYVVNISIYSPLSGRPYLELPDKPKHWKRGLINIKSNDNKCFLWCHIRHFNPWKIHPERITKVDKKW